MKLLLWSEKSQRIKAFSGCEASGFIHEECFNTRIGDSALQIMEAWQSGRLQLTVNQVLTARWFESIRLHQTASK